MHIFLLIGISGCMSAPNTYKVEYDDESKQENDDISNGYIFENRSVVIANFFLTFENTERAVDARIIALFDNYPDLNNTLQHELNNNSIRELELRLYPILDKNLTDDEMYKIIYFIKSESGRRLLSIAKVNNLSDTIKIVSALPPHQQADIDFFLESSWFKSAVDALESQESQQIVEDYLEDFICDFATRNSFKLFTELSAKGKCLTNNALHSRSRPL